MTGAQIKAAKGASELDRAGAWQEGWRPLEHRQRHRAREVWRAS
jgi:hypothetical protein